MFERCFAALHCALLALKKIQNPLKVYFKKTKKHLLFPASCAKIIELVTLIAMKREVAARRSQVFPWSECQVRKLATSHCTQS